MSKERTDEQKKRNAGILGAIPSMVGLATSIGTAVPGLKKVNRTDTSRAAAAEGSGAAQRAAVAGSQTGFGATRGLNLRTGLRQAAEVGKRTAGELARAGTADDQRYDRQNLLRQKRLFDYGANAADMAANIGLGVVESAQANLGVDPEADADEPQFTQHAIGGAPLADTQPGLWMDQAAPQELQELPTGPGPGIDELGPGGADQPPAEALPEFDPFMQALGIPQKSALYSIAPQLELQHRLENLALQEAERQGVPLPRVYAQIQRMQNLPAIQLAQQQLQLQEENQGF